MNYPVTSIFRSLQGEGHFVGYPMTFVRLAGCSVVNCNIRKECDEAPWKATDSLSVDQIVMAVKALQSSGIVCITGGEPSDHDLLPLVSQLHDAGYRVHLETSGVRPVMGMPIEWITVSPKTAPYAQRVGHTLKVVVRPEWGDRAWEFVKGLDAETNFFHRYLQPLSGPDGPANLPQVIEMLQDMHNGGARWALSVQAHKSWGLK